MKKKYYSKVMVIGSGPIVIGQAAEFDYSGTQACRILMEEGITSVLVNSNPATIMTDTSMADAVYIEPLTLPFLEKIIAKERPQGLLAGMGGQTALNLALELSESGILQKYGVEILGTDPEAISRAEDRELFKEMMNRIGEPVIDSCIVSGMEEAIMEAEKLGYPVVIRPAFTLGGTGGGIASNREELEEITTRGLAFSMKNQVLVEKYIRGWKEIEYEMLRDAQGNVITVCNMENIDPVGVHTGDSFVVAPSQTLSDKEYQMLRNASMRIVNALKIVGGCNVQFALDPQSFKYYVIEVNPRVSRSSALASKATGYPIAKVATKIAVGYALDEILNDVTGKTMASFEPTLDYCVVKIPKWPFDKLDSETRKLGTTMMATGEVMAIGNRFESALQKAFRCLENGMDTLRIPKAGQMDVSELEIKVREGDDERVLYLIEMLRRGASPELCSEISQIDPWFIRKFQNIVTWENEIAGEILGEMAEDRLRFYKQRGFSDKSMGSLMDLPPEDIKTKRMELGILPVYKMVDTCGGEFDATSNYFYSTYDREDESLVSDKPKVIVLGSGPIRIGQGVEFDYCSVHGVMALREMGYEAIIINNNPETVSTDFDISDKLYFEPVTEEDVLSIIEKEKPLGVILQYGGQTAIKLATYLNDKGIPILGTSQKGIDMAEDRELFDSLLHEMDIARPRGKTVMTREQGQAAADELGFPVLVRPSYVLGGLGMEIAWNNAELLQWLKFAKSKNPEKPILIDQYLDGIEIEVDAISDGKDVLIPGILEHLEKAGVHSGDSISIYPPVSLSQATKDDILEITRKLAVSMNVIGLINIQFVLSQGKIYVIEVNPRASRTVPYVSKVTGISMIESATRVMMGEPLESLGYGLGLFPERNLHGVKVPVFSMDKIPGTEVAVGPEMKSTGEVLGVEFSATRALSKGLMAAGLILPPAGKIFASISNQRKEDFLVLAKELSQRGYTFMASQGTGNSLKEAGIPFEPVPSGENGPDQLRKGKVIALINLPSKGRDRNTQGFKLRRAAVESKLPCFTSLDTLWALLQASQPGIPSQELHVIDICGLKL